MNDEKTIYDDEKTQYQSQDEEATQYDDSSETKNNADDAKAEDAKPTKDKKTMWKKAAAGAGTGILLGAAATIFSSSAPIDHTEEGEHQPEHPDWTDGEVPVATAVNDDMSFSEAFGAARAEVGSGGVFEWHGNIYSTYTEEEWGNMTAEERAEYGSHFNWHGDASHDTASSSSTAHQSQPAEEVEVVAANTNTEQSAESHGTNGTDVEIAGVIPGTGDDVNVDPEEPEVEILGVVHDDETGFNIGGMVIDGQEVVLIDLDNDSVFDVAGTDQNGDQQITSNEFVNISNANITVNDLGGISNPDDSMYASDDNGIDYANDAGVYEV